MAYRQREGEGWVATTRVYEKERYSSPWVRTDTLEGIYCIHLSRHGDYMLAHEEVKEGASGAVALRRKGDKWRRIPDSRRFPPGISASNSCLDDGTVTMVSLQTREIFQCRLLSARERTPKRDMLVDTVDRSLLEAICRSQSLAGHSRHRALLLIPGYYYTNQMWMGVSSSDKEGRLLFSLWFLELHREKKQYRLAMPLEGLHSEESVSAEGRKVAFHSSEDGLLRVWELDHLPNKAQELVRGVDAGDCRPCADYCLTKTKGVAVVRREEDDTVEFVPYSKSEGGGDS